MALSVNGQPVRASCATTVAEVDPAGSHIFLARKQRELDAARPEPIERAADPVGRLRHDPDVGASFGSGFDDNGRRRIRRRAAEVRHREPVQTSVGGGSGVGQVSRGPASAAGRLDEIAAGLDIPNTEDAAIVSPNAACNGGLLPPLVDTDLQHQNADSGGGLAALVGDSPLDRAEWR
jgi:hypothetical protein